MSIFTHFLYARPSFAEGAARILDMGGTLNSYNKSLSAEQADLFAIYSDWLSVGADLEVALEKCQADSPRLEEALLNEAWKALST